MPHATLHLMISVLSVVFYMNMSTQRLKYMDCTLFACSMWL